MVKRGQIGIFVIVAVILVAAILMFFTLRNRLVSPSQEGFDAQSFISQCMQIPVKEHSEDMMAHGGFSSPKDFVVYGNMNITYLCATTNYYEPCVMQYPLYISSVRDELYAQISENVDGCVQALRDELQRRAYTFEDQPHSYEVLLKPRVVEIQIHYPISVEQRGVQQKYTSFTVPVRTYLYDLASIAHEIARQEAQFCYFENAGFMALYQEYTIDKDVLSEGTKIYTIIHKTSREQLRIAIRGCVIPAGF